MIAYELQGGPADGYVGKMTETEWEYWDGPMRQVFVTGGQCSGAVGRYVMTRKLTREGRLVYEWRPEPPGVVQ